VKRKRGVEGESLDASFVEEMDSIMQDTITTEPATSIRRAHSALDVLSATFITMIVVFVISKLSLVDSVSLGSFAGFCIAAWNWFRMGRRRKALAHVLLGLGVYLGFLVSYALLAVLLVQMFPPSTPVETEFNIPGIIEPGTRMLSTPQTNWLIPLLLIAYCLIVGVLVLLYLYRATARDVPPTEPLEDGDELKRFLPLLVVAAISAGILVLSGTAVMQIRKAQFQNHVYCELLHPGMTFDEVSTALNQADSHMQVWFQDEPYPSLSDKASYYRVVWWDNYRLDTDYDLSLWLGYDANDQLVWKGRDWVDWSKKPIEEGYDTIECPWTFYQSVTAR
jgi:hypothetical protein